jgi:small subunit ribosomal protein S17
MAPETPETPEDEQTTAGEAAPEAPAAEEPTVEPEAPAADEPETPAAAPRAPAPEPVPQLAPKERKAASRAQRGRRRGSTPAERAEIRAQKAVARRRRREQEKAKRPEREPGEGTPVADRAPGTPQVRTGRVVSDKADKTITVRIDIARRHRRYRKIVRSSMTLHAHDEANDANAGDYVRVVESRPMSRTKRWRLVEVLERAK